MKTEEFLRFFMSAIFNFNCWHYSVDQSDENKLHKFTLNSDVNIIIKVIQYNPDLHYNDFISIYSEKLGLIMYMYEIRTINYINSKLDIYYSNGNYVYILI